MGDFFENDRPDQVLPTGLESILSEQDKLLNRLRTSELISIFENQECKMYVDQLGAMKAAQAGVSVSWVATLLPFCFPVFLLAAPILFFTSTWWYSLLALALAMWAFKTSRSLVVSDIRKAALADSEALQILMRNGVVWFETV